MIKRYQVKNFKNLVGIGEEFHPQALNVIIGPNGCGKTSLFQSIDFLRAFCMNSIELYVHEKGWELRDLANVHPQGMTISRRAEDGTTAKFRTFIPRTTIHWQIDAELPADVHGSGEGSYSYSVSLSTRTPARIIAEALAYNPVGLDQITLMRRDRGRMTLLNRENGTEVSSEYFAQASGVMGALDRSRDRSKFPEVIRFREWLESVRSFSLWDPKILRSTNRGKHDELGPNGEHLASFLALLKKTRPSDFNNLLRRIKRAIPYVSDIALAGGRGWGWRMIQQHEESAGRKATVGSQQMSDGVLRLLAVSSLLCLEKIPSVIMFEEPENGIHPQLLREVVSIMRELTLQKSPRQCQVFFTTHSPYVLDEFIKHPEEVFIMDRRPDNKGAAITQLSGMDKEKFDRLSAAFPSLGEAWYTGLIGGTAKG